MFIVRRVNRYCNQRTRVAKGQLSFIDLFSHCFLSSRECRWWSCRLQLFPSVSDECSTDDTNRSVSMSSFSSDDVLSLQQMFSSIFQSDEAMALTTMERCSLSWTRSSCFVSSTRNEKSQYYLSLLLSSISWSLRRLRQSFYRHEQIKLIYDDSRSQLWRANIFSAIRHSKFFRCQFLDTFICWSNAQRWESRFLETRDLKNLFIEIEDIHDGCSLADDDMKSDGTLKC